MKPISNTTAYKYFFFNKIIIYKETTLWFIMSTYKRDIPKNRKTG